MTAAHASTPAPARAAPALTALALKLAGALLFLTALAMWMSRAPDWPVESLVARWAPPPSQFIDLDGQLVHLRDEGPRADPEPLVLLHGSAGSLHTWEGWARALRARHRVITLDLPGFGLTGARTDADYRTDADARFVLALLDRLGVQRFVPGGNGLGGEVAARIARLAPDRAAGLILVAPAGLAGEPAPARLGAIAARLPLLPQLFETVLPRPLVVAGLQYAYGDPGRIDDAVVDRYWQLMLRDGNRRALAQRLAQDAGGSGAGRIGELSMPVLILWGGRDRLIAPDAGRRLAAQITGSRLVVFDDLGHLPQEEDPARSAAAAAAFLAR